jgi:hypothetical protein
VDYILSYKHVIINKNNPKNPYFYKYVVENVENYYNVFIAFSKTIGYSVLIHLKE